MVCFYIYAKSLLGYILEGLVMENVGIFYGHFETFCSKCGIFMALWYIF
jgi:hypothetical protein